MIEGASNVPRWEVQDNGCLYRKFEFKNFVEAFSFMVKVAMEAEKIGHHPEWKNSYNVVEVWLITHADGAITEKDVRLAETINDLAPVSM